MPIKEFIFTTKMGKLLLSSVFAVSLTGTGASGLYIYRNIEANYINEKIEHRYSEVKENISDLKSDLKSDMEDLKKTLTKIEALIRENQKIIHRMDRDIAILKEKHKK